MTSKKDVYTWIADYACKHRIENIIIEVFRGIDGDIISYGDISHMNLKNALVWMTVKNDVQEELEEAISAVDSLLDAAIAANSLEMFIRLSLGLRLKDLYHSILLPLDKFEVKVERHFPGSKFQLDRKYLSMVFSDSQLDDFESSVADMCNYFRALVKSDEQKMSQSTDDPKSHGIKLTGSLESLTRLFFDRLIQDQPLSKLEQIVKSGVENFETHDSSLWHVWLVDRLSGVKILDDDLLRNLMASLQWHEAVGHASSASGILGVRRTGLKRKLRNSSAKVTKPIDVTQGNDVILINRTDHCDELVNNSDDSSSSDLDGRLSFVPSSQRARDNWTREKKFGSKMRKGSDNCRLPNLKQFLKQDGIQGCVVKISRI